MTEIPSTLNECWAMDFVSDQLYNGKRFRILSLIDLYSRECLALVTEKRDIPFGNSAYNALLWLEEYQNFTMRENGYTKATFNRFGFVLCNPHGGFIEPKAYEKNFKRLLGNMGHENFTIHATRHSFATRTIMEHPEEIMTISEILGHAAKSTTLDMYRHTFLERKRSVMDNY